MELELLGLDELLLEDERLLEELGELDDEDDEGGGGSDELLDELQQHGIPAMATSKTERYIKASSLIIKDRRSISPRKPYPSPSTFRRPMRIPR